jgi:hypothetical protein
MLRLKTDDELADEAQAREEARADAHFRQQQHHLFGEPPPPIPEEPELSELEEVLAFYTEA